MSADDAKVPSLGTYRQLDCHALLMAARRGNHCRDATVLHDSGWINYANKKRGSWYSKRSSSPPGSMQRLRDRAIARQAPRPPTVRTACYESPSVRRDDLEQKLAQALDREKQANAQNEQLQRRLEELEAKISMHA